MGFCINHKDTQTSFQCMKHGVYLCQACLACPDPEIYCKFRASCAIHFMTEKGFDDKQVDEPVFTK